MLKQLTLKNFKVFRELTLDFADITILIGPQGVGKSTILDALSLLAQSSGQGNLNLSGAKFKDLQFIDVVHNRAERETVHFGLQFEFLGAYPPIADGPSHTVSYSLEIDRTGFREQRAEYVFPDKNLKWEFRTPRIPGQPFTPNSSQFESAYRIRLQGYQPILFPFTYVVLGLPTQAHSLMLQSLRQLSREISDYTRGLHIVPTNRELLANYHPVQQQQVVAPFNSVIDAINWLAKSWNELAEVSNWLNSIVERYISCNELGNQIFVQAAGKSGILHPVMNEGSGLRQLIWPLAALAAAELGSLVAIEEPEIHLHPRAQTDLCELLREVTKLQSKKLLLTTHSDHMLMGFLMAVAEDKLKPQDLAIYYLNVSGGVATAERLNVNEHGMVEGGLKGFFEAGLDELEKYLEALSKQKTGT